MVMDILGHSQIAVTMNTLDARDGDRDKPVGVEANFGLRVDG
jgi:hypothetical protein